MRSSVGTMFTALQELAAAGDPNSTQFPYSTYSMSLELARRVGGFDAEWIGEDWHMGIKCYLLTMGLARVKPILLPICNFTPEDTTWWGTVIARWSQAKRHALGFSDIAYYFMMLPLMYAYASSRSSESRGKYILAFWGTAINGLRLVVRLINVHVIIGVITTYGVLEFTFRIGMEIFMHKERRISELWLRTGFWFQCMFIATIGFMLLVTSVFNLIYHFAKGRIEKEGSRPSVLFRSNFVHWMYTALCFIAFGPVYFAALAYAVWRAAVLVLVSDAFAYEVAPKMMLMGESPRTSSSEDSHQEISSEHQPSTTASSENDDGAVTEISQPCPP